MRVFHGLDALPRFRKAVITIGSFDGVHCGHRHILAQLRQRARQVGGESIVVTFHPHPRLVLFPDDPSLKLLSTIEEKAALMARFGVDNLVVVPFTKDFSEQTPDEYVEHFLVRHFQPAHICIGYDHRFGNKRAGGIDYLKASATRFGFAVEEIPKQEVDDMAVSSTKVRQALLETGDIALANALLGHRFQIEGRVVKGDAIGRTLGFPTANIAPHSPHKLIPADGVYAVEVHIGERRAQGMLYIGQRPTLAGKTQRNIEVNIFDFQEDIYEKELRCVFLERIREDRKFDSLEALRQQLASDRQDTLAALRAKMLAPKVAVVVLNYNGRALLQQLLPALLASSYPNLELIVADNASSDDSRAFLQQHYAGRVRLIALAENFGFAKGYNLALAQVQADYAVLLNSDVEVTPDWLQPLVALMESRPDIGACQPKIRDFYRRQHFEYAGAAGGFVDVLGYPFCRGRLFDTLESDAGQYDAARPVFWASGAALMLRPQCYAQLGGLAEYFFAHMEEIDLCWRLQRAGWQVWAEPASTVYHMGGATLGAAHPRKSFLNFRNSLFVLYRHLPANRLFTSILLRLLLDGLAGLQFLAKGQIGHFAAVLRAHASFYAHWPALRRQRRALRLHDASPDIPDPRQWPGHYGRSIVWQYFAKGKKHFSALP